MFEPRRVHFLIVRATVSFNRTNRGSAFLCLCTIERLNEKSTLHKQRLIKNSSATLIESQVDQRRLIRRLEKFSDVPPLLSFLCLSAILNFFGCFAFSLRILWPSWWRTNSRSQIAKCSVLSVVVLLRGYFSRLKENNSNVHRNEN